MADEKGDKTHDEGYELDLDDTISSWDQVVEEAVAAVEKDADEEDAAVLEVSGGEESAPAQRALGERAPGGEAQAGADESANVKSLRDQLLRALADFDNFRKRAEREKALMQRYALFDVLKDFLDVSDNLGRALVASGSADDLKVGVEMIARQLSDLLRRYGVERVEAVGRPFDPTVHEAVAREESAQVDAPTVVSELQRGYRLHDRLLRPAMVTVAMPAAAPEPTESSAGPRSGSAEEKSPSEEARAEARKDDEALGERVGQATEAR
jgi:molecular chaperone GrpE